MTHPQSGPTNRVHLTHRRRPLPGKHLGKLETTVVGSDLYLAPVTPDQLQSMSGVPYPDLFVAFDADPAGYLARNGYVISEQGKPPDFVLEIASRSTGRRDTVDKRISYAALGIQEYWRFDETGQFHGTRLAGDSLVNGQYEPLPIEALTDGSLQGYSAILSLNLRWTEGQLGWYPNTGEHIPTLDDAAGPRQCGRGPSTGAGKPAPPARRRMTN